MGSAFSAGSDNDELTDNLCNADFIRSTRIERLFRAVDRGEYILPANRLNAYKDQAWRSSHLHLSAPCIYSEVLEGLNLTSGLSFLNLGSGTGYLSTLVGLVLGYNGINHGVEYYDDVIEYANRKLEDFKRYSGAIDEFDFCEPKFMQGNCFCLSTDRRYDRVYVGAACPVSYDHYLKNFIKVGGILVMPFHDQLLQVRRVSEQAWNTTKLLPVSFATLIMPKEGCNETIDLMDFQPDSLQSLCRTKIRNNLRHSIEIENPDLCCPKKRQKKAGREAAPTSRQKLKINNVQKYLHRVVADHQVLRDIMHHYDSSSSNDNDNESNTSDQEETNAAQSASNDGQDRGSREEIARHQRELAENGHEEATVSQLSEDAQQQRKSDHQRRKFDSGIGDDESIEDEPLHESSQGNSKRSKLDWTRYVVRNDPASDSSSTSSCDTIEMEDPLRDYPAAGPREGNDEDEEMDHDGNRFAPICIHPLQQAADGDYERSLMRDREFYEKRRTVDSPFTGHMCKRINDLPLPTSLKSYLNFYRF